MPRRAGWFQAFKDKTTLLFLRHFACFYLVNGNRYETDESEDLRGKDVSDPDAFKRNASGSETASNDN